jgi:hypothetical protein
MALPEGSLIAQNNLFMEEDKDSIHLYFASLLVQHRHSFGYLDWWYLARDSALVLISFYLTFRCVGIETSYFLTQLGQGST